MEENRSRELKRNIRIKLGARGSEGRRIECKWGHSEVDVEVQEDEEEQENRVLGIEVYGMKERDRGARRSYLSGRWTHLYEQGVCGC